MGVLAAGIRIHAIRVGSAADRDLMTQIADIGSGHEFFAVGSTENYSVKLRQIFAAIGREQSARLIEWTGRSGSISDVSHDSSLTLKAKTSHPPTLKQVPYLVGGAHLLLEFVGFDKWASAGVDRGNLSGLSFNKGGIPAEGISQRANRE